MELFITTPSRHAAARAALRDLHRGLGSGSDGTLVNKLAALRAADSKTGKIATFTAAIHADDIACRILQEGDIINVDVSTIYKGYFSDASRMFKMGKVSERAERIVRVTEECVKLGLEAAKPWGHLGDIADAINTHARANGYSVVEDIGGHGVGLEFHEDPFVSYVTPKGSEMLLVPGMMFTIEPMINEGSPDFFVDEDNDWTVYTMDDGLSAQIEYMVLITENGAEVLTK